MGSSQSRADDGHDTSRHFVQGPIPPRTPISSKPAEVQVGNAASVAPQPRLTTLRPVREAPPILLPKISSPGDLFQYPSIKFGAYSAGAGLLFGSVFGILHAQPPILFPIVSGIQWGVAGTCFSGIRSAALDSLGDSRESRISATMLGSAGAGGAASVLGGRRGVLYSMLVFSVFGLGGQLVWDWREARRKETGDTQTWLEWVSKSKYSPLKMLSDEEYKAILEKKLLKVETEIAVLEDDIKALKEKERRSTED